MRNKEGWTKVNPEIWAGSDYWFRIKLPFVQEPSIFRLEEDSHIEKKDSRYIEVKIEVGSHPSV